MSPSECYLENVNVREIPKKYIYIFFKSSGIPGTGGNGIHSFFTLDLF